VASVLEITLYVVEAGVGVVPDWNHVAGDQRAKVGGQFPAAAAGENDGVDIPVIGPKSIDLIGDVAGQLLIHLVADFDEIEALALHFDGSVGRRPIQAIKRDADAAPFPEFVGDDAERFGDSAVGGSTAAIDVTQPIHDGKVRGPESDVDDPDFLANQVFVDDAAGGIHQQV